MTEADSTKRCTKCRRELPTASFRADRRTRPDGTRSHCKECEKAYRESTKDQMRKWREANAAKIRAEQKRWERENRQKVRATKNRYYQRNRDRIKLETPPHSYDPEAYQRARGPKLRARDAVNRAVRLGKIPRARDCDCVDCGHSAAHYDHVHGYAKDDWLRVEPVCTTCHGKRARERDEFNHLD